MQHRDNWHGFDGTQKPPAGWILDASHPLSAGLVFAPPLDEGAGSGIRDASPGDNFGTVTAANPWANGRAGKVLAFDATYRAVFPNSPSLNLTGSAFTVSVRVNGPSGEGANKYLLGKSNVSNKGYALYTGSGLNGKFIFSSGGSLKISIDLGTTLCDGTWHHVAYTYDGASLRGYVDGRLMTTDAFTGSVDDSSTEVLYLGGVGAGTTGSNWFTGQLDAPRIWTRTLSNSEVDGLYSRPWADWRPPAVRRPFAPSSPPVVRRAPLPVTVASRRPRVVGAVAGRHLAGPATLLVTHRPPLPVLVASRRPRVVGAVAGRHLAGPATPLVAPSLAFRPIWAAGSNVLIGG